MIATIHAVSVCGTVDRAADRQVVLVRTTCTCIGAQSEALATALPGLV